MPDVLVKAGIITLGNPTIHLKMLRGRIFFTHASFCFMKDKSVVNLYDGQHPSLRISESGLKLNFSFDAARDKLDLGILLEKAISEQAEELIKEAGITVTQGKPAQSSDFHFFEVTQEHPLKGLTFDPNAIAHRNWFE